MKKEKQLTKSNIELPTKMTSGDPKLSQIRLLIYGAPKIGKTTLLSGFPNVLLLATEKRYKHLKVYPIDIKSWEDFKQAVKLILKGKHEFKTIGIDTADILFKLCRQYVCDELNIDHESEETWGKGYDAIQTEFERELNKLFLTDYGIIITAHTREVEVTNRAGRFNKIVASLPNQARKIILPKVGVIGYMKLKTVKLKDGGYKEKRIISFDSSEFEEAGDGEGKLPNEIIAYKDPSKTYELFKQYYSTEKGGEKL